MSHTDSCERGAETQRPVTPLSEQEWVSAINKVEDDDDVEGTRI